jgi:predicted nucleotide-binding protein (sugar kinase/HSP70/actin superfamily)
MRAEKKELINALNNSIKQLQQGIDTHCHLVNSIVEDNLNEGSLQLLLETCPKRMRERKLEEAIKEAIDTLEESRKSFKSKRLEALRKKLTHVLIDQN